MRAKEKLLITIVLVLVFGGLAGGTLANSNSIIDNDIEYYMQTDKAVYDLGGNVEMLYRVTNLGVEDVTFEFTAGPVDDRGDFIVEKDGEVIWDNLHRPATAVLTSFTLTPSEPRNFTWFWDMTDLIGNQVIPGNYYVTGVLGALSLNSSERYVPVSVPIQVVPEPTTFTLLGTGLVSLLACRRKKRRQS